MAQVKASAAQSGTSQGNSQKIYVVLPFENASASPRLDWLGEGLEELTIQRLSAAGEQVYSHAGRAADLERYGLPRTSKFTRATMIRIAEDLDADFVVFGRYTANGNSLAIEMRMLCIDPMTLRPAVRETGPLNALMDLHTRLLWRTLAANDRRYRLSQEEFKKRQRPLRLDAFEQYIRGLLATDDEAKLRQLHEAARLDPDWPDPNFALGEAYYARKDYNSALAWFFKVPKTHDRGVEALFFSGVCRLQLNQADRAEEIFNSLLETLRKSTGPGADMPEILNNLAVARGRLGKIAAAQADLRHAAEMAPGEDDYPFNLGLLAVQGNDAAAAADYFREASEREPDSAEDRTLLILSLEKAGKQPEADQEREAAKEAFGPNGLPAIQLDAKNEAVAKLARIKTELDVTSLRAEIETAETSGTAADAANDTSAARIRRARQELSAGQVEAAEKQFRAVLAVDSANAAAHRGLGEIDRRRGKLDDAVKELQASLGARDSAEVRTMLAKIYLEQKKPDMARAEAEKALKLAPNYSEAKQFLDHLQNSAGSKKKPGGGAQ
ncbi:MAG TPA: tetratricopeptide repeat protein [Candidatus Acidoferrum sp.]|nr:tetratricopeptide repeat protein [Candidatus Acidoferrum sp.]